MIHVQQIEKAFVQVAINLHAIIVVDRIDLPADRDDPIRIHCHDMHGQLPEVVVPNLRDSWELRELVEREAAKMDAMSRIRGMLAECYPNCRFLPPTMTDRGVVVGLISPQATIMAGRETFIEAYHALRRI